MSITGKQNLKGYIKNILRKHWLFFVAFMGMAIYLKLSGSMVSWSGDAGSIWTTIKSFPSGNIIPSYVLYKGFAAIYPYLWFYQLSQFFGIGEFFFVKLFHCILFAYMSTVGFPYLVENLLHVKAKVWRKALLMLFFFWFWKGNHAFDQLMVDLPSLAYFLLLVNSALKISKFNSECLNIRRIGRYIYTGLLIGLNMCVSGQYTAAAICIILYLIIKTVPLKVLKEKAKRLGAILCIIVLVVCLEGVRLYNGYFEDTVIDPMREQGIPIATNQQWLECDFMRLIGIGRNSPGPTIPDNRGLSIAKDLYGDQYGDMYQKATAGGVSLTIGQYFKLVAKYPLDFLVRYADRLFFAFSPDGGRLSFSHLFLAYTLLFVPFVIFKKRCKTVRQFFSAKILIVLSFVFAIAASIILNVEERFTMQIQGLIYALALLDDTLWDGFKCFGRTIKECCTKKTLRGLGERKFPFSFIVYLIFILFCFSHIASLYSSIGIDPANVLFSF